MTDPAFLSLVLHAHLPYVRHPEQPDFLEEDWYFEAVLEVYVPLLRLLRGLPESTGAAGPVMALSFSPPLVAMFQDPTLDARMLRYLDRQLAVLMVPEVQSANGEAVELLIQRAETTRAVLKEIGGTAGLPSAFAALRDSGIVELATTAVTHGFLPALEQMPGAVDRQIEAGIAAHGAAFGATPMGFWLPECGWFTGVDRLLRSQGIEWTVVDSHAVALATPPPEQGIHAPCCTESGLVLFARDRESARQVWDAEHGYPGNGEYRDFHLDAGDWMTEASVEAVLPEGRRRPTGVKIHRVTDRAGGPKELYRPSRAMKQAATDALHFLHSRAADAVRLRQSPTVRSGMLCAFDAELFGHWWHEGTVWLEAVLRESAWFAPGMRLASPGAIVRNGGVLQILEPSPSSWGEGGYARSWLNPRVAEVYPELHRATLRLEEWYREVPPALAHDAALRKRVWLQLQTELFLAQSSDWPFLIHRGTAPEYAAMRISDHLDAFERLSNLSRSCGPEMVAFLESREQKYPEFYHAP